MQRSGTPLVAARLTGQVLELALTGSDIASTLLTTRVAAAASRLTETTGFGGSVRVELPILILTETILTPIRAPVELPARVLSLRSA